MFYLVSTRVPFLPHFEVNMFGLQRIWSAETPALPCILFHCRLCYAVQSSITHAHFKYIIKPNIFVRQSQERELHSSMQTMGNNGRISAQPTTETINTSIDVFEKMEDIGVENEVLDIYVVSRDVETHSPSIRPHAERCCPHPLAKRNTPQGPRDIAFKRGGFNQTGVCRISHTAVRGLPVCESISDKH
jgi:hypothetical protein